MPTEPEYAELHCHSSYSLLDGASQPEELIGQARALGLRALALTDHDGLYIAPTFCRLAEAADLQPIVGAEVTLAGSVSPPPERAADPLPGGDLLHPPRPRRGTDPPTGGPGGSPPAAASSSFDPAGGRRPGLQQPVPPAQSGAPRPAEGRGGAR